MKITRRQIRRLLEQETSKNILPDDKIKDKIVKTIGVNADEVGEGGAAGFDPIKKAVDQLADEENAELPEELDTDEELKNFIKDEIDGVAQHAAGDYIETSGLTEKAVRQIVRESLKKLGFYKKYSYGLDDVPDKTKAHDDIIGHT